MPLPFAWKIRPPTNGESILILITSFCSGTEQTGWPSIRTAVSVPSAPAVERKQRVRRNLLPGTEIRISAGIVEIPRANIDFKPSFAAVEGVTLEIKLVCEITFKDFEVL
jgi:hypothetical protein